MNRNNSLIFSSEKGGAGKTAILGNVAAFTSYRDDSTVLVVDGDVTNQSTTKQLLPSLKNDKINELEQKGMFLSTEKLLTGLFDEKLSVESAFSRLSQKAIPRSSIPVQSLFVLPSKGRTRFGHNLNPNAILEPMNKLNSALLDVFDHLFYDTEATSNVLKEVLVAMDSTELVSIVTPENLDVEMDMLAKYENDSAIVRGIILNNVFEENISEQLTKIYDSGFPLISLIPFDMQMILATHRRALVVGDGSNVDYALRVTSLNLTQQRKLDEKQIKAMFSNAESVYNTFASSTPELKRKQIASDSNNGDEKKTTLPGNPFSFISKLMNTKVSGRT